MKISKFEICIDGIKNICKQPSLWGADEDTHELRPLVYFQKPKWIDEDSFKEIISSIRLHLPKDFRVKK